jgi:indoleacetamide hydrolase
MPMPVPLLPTDGDAVPPIFEVNGRQYPDTAFLLNSFSAPAFRAAAFSIPAGLRSEGLPAGLELDGQPGEDSRLLSLGMAIEAVLGPLPPPTFRTG